MAIYLVDYENVYIEGLSGIELLTEEDTLHIFYTHNRCGLTFGLYEQLIACKAKVVLNEVSVSPRNGDPVKNALDLQLMMYTGFLIGAKATDKLCIVSKDKDFQLGTHFFAENLSDGSLTLEIVPNIAASLAQPEPEALLQPEAEESYHLPAEQPNTSGYDAFVSALQQTPATSFAALCEQYAKPEILTDLPAAEPEIQDPLTAAFLTGAVPDAGTSPLFTVQYYNTVRNLLGKGTDEATVSTVCEIISQSDNLVAFNNALARYYKDGERTKRIYHIFKPKFENLRHLSKAHRKG